MTKVYIKTWGCSLNKADSEAMAGLLKEARFELVNNEEEADVVVLNSCTIKGPSERSLFRELERYKGSYKKIIIAGCVAQTEPGKLKGYPLVGTRQIHKIKEIVEEALNENVMEELAGKENPPLNLPKIRINPVVEIIPIGRGCLGECSYCKTRAARGKLISYPIKEIKVKMEKALKEGVKEVWLTAQDCGCYGFDLGTDLGELLKELVRVGGDYKIRIGMMNPEHLKAIKGKLIEAYKSEKVFKFLHLPVQSGNNKILKRMKRKYTVEDFVGLVGEFRQELPELTLSTDVIVGFPGEKEEEYWETLNLVRKVNPEVLNISKFWPRPGTWAAKMEKRVPGEEIKRRAGVLKGIFTNIALMQNEKWRGWEGEILIDEEGKEKGQWLGRNFAYKQVIVEGDFRRGEKIKVRVEKVTPFDLRGKVG